MRSKHHGEEVMHWKVNSVWLMLPWIWHICENFFMHLVLYLLFCCFHWTFWLKSILHNWDANSKFTTQTMTWEEILLDFWHYCFSTDHWSLCIYYLWSAATSFPQEARGIKHFYTLDQNGFQTESSVG